MNARKTLSLVGLTALFAMGAPVLAADQPHDTRESQSQLAAVLPDQSEISATDSSIHRGGPLTAVLWVSYLFRLSNF